jgi:hypothetical protein
MNKKCMQLLTLLAVFVEGTVKYITGSLQKRYRDIIKSYIPYFTLLFGCILALNFKLDILQIFGISVASVFPWVSYFMTGVIIGRGSNYLNDLISRLKTVDNPPLSM